jgi:hypothetical protein
MNRAVSSFNKIYIIQSLPDKDMKTGKRLFDGLVLHVNSVHPELTSEYIEATDAAALFAAVLKIRDDTKAMKNKTLPLIHLEAHGDEEGLMVASGEHLEWERIEQLLREINLACYNNLLLTLGVCKGIHLINIAMPIHPAPFWGLIAPEATVTAAAVEDGFNAFYEEFLTSFDGNMALDKLNGAIPKGSPRFEFVNSIMLFIYAYRDFHRNYCMGQGRKQWLESMLTKARIMLPGRHELRRQRALLKGKVKDRETQREWFEKYERQFFMTDLYPWNAKRFDLTFEEVVGPLLKQ